MHRIKLMFRMMVTFWCLAASTLLAQTNDPTQKPPAAVGEEQTKPTRGFASALVHNLVDDLRRLPRRNSLYWLAGGTTAALLVHPYDGQINRRLLGSDAADTFFKPGKFIGNTGVVLGMSSATYLVGRAMGNSHLQHLGLDEIEATILSEGLSQGIKVIVRRDRPVDSTGQQASGYSFPSGHATLTFAAATVLQQHLGYKAGVPTYLVASYVAMSRLHDNRHFASDVVGGATLGIIIGRSVTYHGRNFWSMAPALVPLNGGWAIVFSKTNRG